MTTTQTPQASPVVSVLDFAAALGLRMDLAATVKVHILAYYAQGFHLAITGQPFFNDVIEARASGPVIPALLDAPVPSSPKVLSPMQEAVLTDVFNNYGQRTGSDLAERAMNEGPWLRSYRFPKLGEASVPVIGHDLLQAYFQALMEAPLTPAAYANRFMDDFLVQRPFRNGEYEGPRTTSRTKERQL